MSRQVDSCHACQENLERVTGLTQTVVVEFRQAAPGVPLREPELEQVHGVRRCQARWLLSEALKSGRELGGERVSDGVVRG